MIFVMRMTYPRQTDLREENKSSDYKVYLEVGMILCFYYTINTKLFCV